MSTQPTTIPPRSILATLRALMPPRRLARWERERVTELQASRFLELAEVHAAPVSSEIITELPRLQVVSVNDLPVSGAAQWVGGHWLISVAGHEHPARQRFSLAHEFKHVLDHPFRHTLYTDHHGCSNQDEAERLADYFAACLLMPKRLIVRAFTQGVQRPSALADMFGVSAPAIRVRLRHLGLTDPAPRCARGYRRPLVHYQRAPSRPVALGAAAT